METARMGRYARLAWDHAVEEHRRSSVARPGLMTCHILLGVLKYDVAAGGLILAKIGLDLDLAKRFTEFVLLHGRRRDGAEEPPVDWGGVPHTLAARKVLDLSFEEADLFSPTYPIGTEHLTLALLRVPEGMGFRVLQHFGIRVEGVRAARDELWELLRSPE